MKEKGKIIVILEIASASVGGLLVRQNEEHDKLQIIFHNRMPVNFLFDINFEASWRCTRDSLKKVIKNLLKNYPAGPAEPDCCLCVFLSPWFLSQVKRVEVRREKAFKVTEDFFQILMQNEEKNFRLRTDNKLKSPAGKMEFIEHEIIKTELNGYYTKSPIGKMAKTVKSYIYMSLGIKQVKEEIRKEILENFGNIPLAFKTFPLLSFLVLDNLLNNPEGLILVDIGGEITDISSIRKDCLEETISFPRGRNFLLRRISSKFKTFPQEASSLLGAYLKGHISEKNSEMISKIIEEVREEWGNFFEIAIKNISENNPLPQNIFLIGDDIISNQFIKFIEDKRLSQFTVLGKPFNVKKITAGGLNHYLDFEKERPPDIFMVIEALFTKIIF